MGVGLCIACAEHCLSVFVSCSGSVCVVGWKSGVAFRRGALRSSAGFRRGCGFCLGKRSGLPGSGGLMAGRMVVRKSGSVREDRWLGSGASRFSSVREHGSRDTCGRGMTMDLHMPGVGARGSISALMDHDVRCGDGCRSVAERPAEREISRSDRWWMLRRQSRRVTEAILDRNKKDGDNNRFLEAVDENGGRMPRWKRLLRKLKGEAKKRNESETKERLRGSHTATDQDKLHGVQHQGDTQKPLSYFVSLPLPLPNPWQEPQTSIWERRKVGQPSALDLNKVRTAASRHARVRKAHPK